MARTRGWCFRGGEGVDPSMHTTVDLLLSQKLSIQENDIPQKPLNLLLCHEGSRKIIGKRNSKPHWKYLTFTEANTSKAM